jgi:hypothetical protein
MSSFDDISYDPSTGALTWVAGLRRGQTAGCLKNDGYRRVTIGGVNYAEHRLIWFLMTGEWPELQIDHRNGVRDDNRWVNLRQATASQNTANCRKRGPWLKGCTRRRNGRFQAQIGVRGERSYLGTFDTEAEAHAAYLEAAKASFAEFARAA